MSKIKLLIRYLPFSILLITLSSIIQWSYLPLGNTLFWWIINAFIIFLFFYGRSYYYNKSDSILPINIFVFIVLISFFYGIYQSSYYWDWKLLTLNLLIYLLPLSVSVFNSPLIVAKVLNTWLKYALIAFLFLFPFFDVEAYGRYLVPMSIILLFFPVLPIKWKIIGIATLILIVIVSIFSRSNVVKYVIPLIISLIYYFNKLFTFEIIRKILAPISLFLLLSPFLFLFLAAINAFNIFNTKDYLNLNFDNYEYTNEIENYNYNLFDDTRSFIYQEVISSAINNDYVIFGRSMARGYDTVFFSGFYKVVMDETGRSERGASEVGILNIFNYFGLIGVISYFFIFITASIKAIFKSNSIFMMLIGIYVSFRWAYTWVEDYTRFDLNNLFLWIFIAICFSSKFRTMNNREFIQWLKFSIK